MVVKCKDTFLDILLAYVVCVYWGSVTCNNVIEWSFLAKYVFAFGDYDVCTLCQFLPSLICHGSHS